MPAKPIRRSALLALALLMAAAVPVRATTPPTFTVVDSIWPGTGSSYGGGSSDSGALGDYLYFRARTETPGWELWRTNGTSTTSVKDINPGEDSSQPQNFTALGGFLYFQAADSTTGYELWRTDGTEAGTTRVKDINGVGDSYPNEFTALGGFLYFHAEDGTNGYELWRTNGTEAGTTRVKDIFVGVVSSSPDYFTAFGDYLYFQAADSTAGYELWRTNGTEAGTTRVKDINLGVDSSYPAYPTALGDYLYFRATDGTTGDELWRTDGTEAGTTRVEDIRLGENGSNPYNFIALGDFLYFAAYDGTDYRIHRTDGTTTERVPFPIDADQSAGCECAPLTALGGRLYSHVYSAATGSEFAYLDEPTYVLPETNRDGSMNSAWTIALSTLALITLAVGVGLRRRAGVAQR